MKKKSEPHAYDNTLKALFGKEADQIIPYLLPGAEFIGNLRDEERNVEINRSMLKADLVHRIRYKYLPAILNLELQTKDDAGLLLRLLQYHVALYEKHKVPVISVMLYLFQTAVQLPPFWSGGLGRVGGWYGSTTNNFHLTKLLFSGMF